MNAVSSVKQSTDEGYALHAWQSGYAYWRRLVMQQPALRLPESKRAHGAGTQECHIGAYPLSNGSVVDIAQSNEDTLRWRRFDGTTGALHKKASGEWTSTAGLTDVADGKSVTFGGCDQGSIEFDSVRGAQIHFNVRETTFHTGTSHWPVAW